MLNVADLVQRLPEFGYLALFGLVLGEQIGLPIPAAPVFLGVGALAENCELGVAVALAASLPPDLMWYELGRRRGRQWLGRIGRVSRLRDSWVRGAEGLFARYGPRILLVAKFLPGLGTLAPPLAGVVGLARNEFILLDTLGALVWSGTWIAVGYVLRHKLGAAAHPEQFGTYLTVAVSVTVTVCIAAAFVTRWRYNTERG